MGQRLTAIATRTGDDGSTGLGDGSRTSKDSSRVHAMGEVDELNAQLGVLRAQLEAAPGRQMDETLTAIDRLMHEIQHDLFDLGAELCIPNYEQLQTGQLIRLDEALADYNADLPRLAEFILPGGSTHAAQAHVCRTVCRRAERALVALSRNEGVRPLAQQYLNRLSDLLFVIARVLNREAGGRDVLWDRKR